MTDTTEIIWYSLREFMIAERSSKPINPGFAVSKNSPMKKAHHNYTVKPTKQIIQPFQSITEFPPFSEQ